MSFSRFSNLEWINLPDCINLSRYGHCTLLKVARCQGHTCSFMVTPEEKDAAMRRVGERLSSLDEETQERIARKYYKGKRTWKNQA